MNRDGLLFHIPHASTELPFQGGYTRPELIAGEITKLTDWHTDRIFCVPGVAALVAQFSRVFCDVERFVPDELEPMAAKGMGFYYTLTDDGVPFRAEGGWKDRVYREHYVPHHEKLTALVQERLDRFGECLLIDGHSFAEVPFRREADQRPDRPDFCIGTDPFHTPADLASYLVGGFGSFGYSVALNAPYAGAMVPIAYYREDPRVCSVMVEVNRRLYLTSDGGEIPGSINRLNRQVIEIVAGINL